jgi:FAD dependent oxidoreductase TIGR03364
MNSKSAIVIGSGIVGLAIARSLALEGFQVTVLDKTPTPIGASIRNFGMIWPIGQPEGESYLLAMESLRVWKQLSQEAKLWHSQAGSLHIATHSVESDAMQFLASHYEKSRQTIWLNKNELIHKSPAAHPRASLGALYSPWEMIVEARDALCQLPIFFNEKYGIAFETNHTIREVEGHTVRSHTREWQADIIITCSGIDFETLYPEIYASAPLTRCKLQMMRLASQPDYWHMGPPICGGLSLLHYKGFDIGSIRTSLTAYFKAHYPDYLEWGIHVMACQNELHEITVGDTHEYGMHPSPFDLHHLNMMILRYLRQFSTFPSYQMNQYWHGIYAKHTEGKAYFIHRAAPNQWIVNGLGGAGMTLSFGLAEQFISSV